MNICYRTIAIILSLTFLIDCQEIQYDSKNLTKAPTPFIKTIYDEILEKKEKLSIIKKQKRIVDNLKEEFKQNISELEKHKRNCEYVKQILNKNLTELLRNREHCKEDWISFEQECFKVFPQKVLYSEAEQTCKLNGANMISIHSEYENNLVLALFKMKAPDIDSVWIGAKRRSLCGNKFRWSNGNDFIYANWKSGQPDHSQSQEFYVEMVKNRGGYLDGEWNDQSDRKLQFICEMSLNKKWSPVINPMETKWASQVKSDQVWPEYPRPQLERKYWVNLNGLWEYSITDKGSPAPNKYDGQILVPFPVESSLSGVQKAVNDQQTLWYRRQLTLDLGSNELLILNFGAVDYHCQVSLNGHLVGEHKGGYNRFSFDITKFLNGKKDNTLEVKVIDSTGGSQPIGKQKLCPRGILYTSTTGIWQTVWLEKVPKTYITSLRITPDIDSDSVEITVKTNGPIDHSEIKIIDTDEKVVASIVNASLNFPSKITIPAPKLWSATDPYLYKIHVKAGADSVTSYVGMRKIEFKKDSKGINRFFLNNKAIFMFGALDQGFWPDGVYTPPNEEAMIYDLRMIREFGFNTIRKHLKVESDRWYYATDKMGFLVWQDFPSVDSVHDVKRIAADIEQVELEMERMVEQLHNFPSITLWVPYDDTERIISLFRKWDPSRLITEASGGNDRNINSIGGRLYRGQGIFVKEHVWDPVNVIQHQKLEDSQRLQKFFIDRLATVRAHAIFGLRAAIYIQITDIESEINGLLTYDRDVIKVGSDAQERIKKYVDRLYPSQSVNNIIFPSGHQSNDQEWHYTTEAPVGNWTCITYDSYSWSKGKAGFGTRDTPDITIHTEWNTPDIWLRKEFEIPAGKLPNNPVLHIFYDDKAKVYINGVEVDNEQFVPFQTDYSAHDIDSKVFREGKNAIAIHCHNFDGKQGIDAGIIDVSYDN